MKHSLALLLLLPLLCYARAYTPEECAGYALTAEQIADARDLRIPFSTVVEKLGEAIDSADTLKTLVRFEDDEDTVYGLAVAIYGTTASPEVLKRVVFSACYRQGAAEHVREV